MMSAKNFRVFGPDETASNRLEAFYEETGKEFMEPTLATDEFLSPDGRVVEVLSEHMCQGWLEGYLLSGRHGLFSCYEAFIHIVDSMFNQHAKWLKVTRDISWRRPIASLNYLLTSHVWRQDHNGFTHQDPGFIDLVVNKKADIVRVYLPPDANSLLVRGGSLSAQPKLRERDRCRKTAGVAVPGYEIRNRALHLWAWNLGLGFDGQRKRAGCRDGVRGRYSDARDSRGGGFAAAEFSGHQDSRRQCGGFNDDCSRDRNIRTGLPMRDFDSIFTADKPVIFAYHGYPG